MPTVDLTASNFTTTVETHAIVLVDFRAEWLWALSYICALERDGV